MSSVVLVIGGLGATAGRLSGTVRLADRIRSEIPGATVIWREHDDDAKQIAAATAAANRLLVVAHSWGVPKALKVARVRWKKHGKPTAYLASIDGVSFMKFANFLFGPFTVPSWIHAARAFRQTVNHPRGRGFRPRWGTPSQNIREEIVLLVPHNAMDDNDRVHEVIIRDIRHTF